MSRENISKKSFGRILFRTAVILLSIAVIASGAISYAKFISASGMDDASGVAIGGIEVFELEQYGGTQANIDFSQVVPGADIPGPRVNLKMYSEVKWSLFVKVTETGFPAVDDENDELYDKLYKAKGNSIGADVIVGMNEDDSYKTERHSAVVSYSMNDNWTLINTEIMYAADNTPYYVKTYQSTAFQPSTKYNYTNTAYEGYETLGGFTLLDGDSIFISQYYNSYDDVNGNYSKGQKFGLAFEVYIRQVQS